MGPDGGGDSMGGMGGGGGGQMQAYGDVFSDVMQFFGAMLAQDSATKSAQADMAEADNNAKLASIQAADAIRRGNIEAGKLRIRGTQMAASQAVEYTGGGVDATVGTPAENAKYTAAVTELDAQTAANNAARQAWGFKEQEKHFQRERQNRLDKWQAQNTQYSLNQIATMGKFGLDAMKTQGPMGGGG